MKKTFLAITALAAVLFAGCTSSDELTTLESIKTADNTPTPVQFGTYMSKLGTTRAAAAEGSITTAQLLAQKGGFGVFAYYTQGYGYGQQQGTTYYDETSPQSNIAPNFMYNQLIRGTDVAEPVWSYSPVKYWPNEIASTAVDNKGATGNAANGNVSFFAYAPYTGVH